MWLCSSKKKNLATRLHHQWNARWIHIFIFEKIFQLDCQFLIIIYLDTRKVLSCLTITMLLWVVIASATGEDFFSYSIEYRVKKGEFRVIKVEYRVIKVEYRVIKVEYRVIKVEYRVMKVEYRVIKVEYRVIKSEYRVIKSEYRVIKSEYRVIKSEYRVIKQNKKTIGCSTRSHT